MQIKKFACIVCGYIHNGDTPPEICPVCKVGSDKFKELKDGLNRADEHLIGTFSDLDSQLLENNCKYDDNQLCSLDSIYVSGNGANLYSETNCESFCKK